MYGNQNHHKRKRHLKDLFTPYQGICIIVLLIIEKPNVHACNGILFNHRSRRGVNFVTKNNSGLLKLKIKNKKILELEIYIQKRLGTYRDYADSMENLNNKKADDYVIATNKFILLKTLLILHPKKLVLKLSGKERVERSWC